MNPDKRDPKGPRSRSGCVECRRRRRKCDEAKPECSYCLKVQNVCCYSQKLRWGGRPFSRSSFGTCLSEAVGVGKIPSSSESSAPAFVYGVISAPVSVKPHDVDWVSFKDFESMANAESQLPLTTSVATSTAQAIPCSINEGTTNFRRTVNVDQNWQNSVLAYEDEEATPNHELLCNPDFLSWIPLRYKFLLDHFAHRMTSSISCHATIQKNLCSTIIPTALSSPHSLNAVLYLAACHRASLGHEQNIAETAHLKSVSIRQLREALSTPTEMFSREAIKTSALILCLAEIVAGGEKKGLWKTHLDGSAAAATSRIGTFDTRSSSTLLERLQCSIENIAMFSNLHGLKELSSFSARRALMSSPFIDELTGFSSALVPILEEMNLLERKRFYFSSSVEPNLRIEEVDGQEICDLLILRIEHGLEHRRLAFRDSIGDTLEITIQADFLTLDTAYHHMALLHMYERTPEPVAQESVDNSVQKILHCISKIICWEPPCPAVAALPPLFVTGLHARNESDRVSILMWMNHMESCFGMGNVRSARMLLEKLWRTSATERTDLGMDTLLWDRIPAEYWQIIPY